MEIEYFNNREIQPSELTHLFQESGLERPDDPARIKRMIEHASIIISAYHNNKLVGIARSVTDFSFCCYLSDLAVHIDYQKKGIGKKLVELLQKQLGDEVMIVLISVPSALDYYPRIGFESINSAFIKKRKR